MLSLEKLLLEINDPERIRKSEEELAKIRSNMLTYKTLCNLFLEKYPNGKIWKHGEMANCDVAVMFSANSKVYNYRGTYDMVGIKLGLIAE